MRRYAAGLVAVALMALLAMVAALGVGAVSVLAVAFVIVTAVLVAVYTSGTVSRRRVERFAVRQRLVVTADNGNQIIRYLATTRRWRVAGFVGGLVASGIFFPRPSGDISVGGELIVIFVGWFAGALIAEARVEHLEHGRVRVASLQPRHPERYVGRFVWALVPGAAVVAVATGAATAAAGALGWAEPNWTWAGVWLLVALTVAVIVRAFQHVVLRRPQPLAAPDVIAADDAIRSRALSVLSAGGAALVLLMVLNQIGSVHPVGVADSVIYTIRILGALGVALFGWLVATSSPPSAAPRPDRTAMDAA
jgi:hypothetical protein